MQSFLHHFDDDVTCNMHSMARSDGKTNNIRVLFHIFVSLIFAVALCFLPFHREEHPHISAPTTRVSSVAFFDNPPSSIHRPLTFKNQPFNSKRSPLVSVIVPFTCNRISTVYETFKSVRRQTLQQVCKVKLHRHRHYTMRQISITTVSITINCCSMK